MSISTAIQNFIGQIRVGRSEIYNEFSAQHELGIVLRNTLGSQMRVQFERPVTYFGLNKQQFEKKEMDIVMFSKDMKTKYAIELKFPRSGQRPEQMFSSCKDIYFLEQLTRAGFNDCYFVMFADDPLFYKRGSVGGIYRFFRGGIPINGKIRKPTGKKDQVINIAGSYTVNWKPIKGSLKYISLKI